MNEALLRTQEEKHNGSHSGKYHVISEADILEYLAFSTYQKGEVSSAIRLTEQLLSLEPNHPRASGNIAHYEKLLYDKRGEDGLETDKVLIVIVIPYLHLLHSEI
jgi:prolyl 4-hydroxylase